MMQTQAVDTKGRDESVRSVARRESWAVVRVLRSSSRFSLVVACAAIVIAAASALSSVVPLAAALPIALLVVPALVDVLDRRLPNRMVATAVLLGAAVAAVTVSIGGQLDLSGAALGAAAFAGPLLVMHLVAPNSMGFGDVKAACVLGAAVGLIHPIYGFLALAAGSFLGAAVGLVGRRRTIAFGPALVAGAIVALLLAASPLDVVQPTAERPSEDVSS